MVTVPDVRQIPLTVATVSHEIAGLSLTGFGLKQDPDLHEQLIHEFLARAMLSDSGSNHEGISTPFEKKLGPCRLEASRLRINAEDLDRANCQIAASLLDLRARLLEYCTHLHDDDASSGHTVDLLREESGHPQIQYLRDVLGCRVRSLPVGFVESAHGLFSYEINRRRCFSFIRAKALRDALLQAAAETFYPTLPFPAGKPGLCVDFRNFIAPATQRQLLRRREEMLARRCPDVRLVFQRLSCWGRNIWAGKMDEGR